MVACHGLRRWSAMVGLCVGMGLGSIHAQEREFGYQTRRIPAAPDGAFVGGLDWLPNGHLAVFDGAAVREVDPADGSVIRTLFTPAGSVYGAFVRCHPTQPLLYFGETRNGNVFAINLDTRVVQLLTNGVFPFDMAHDSLGTAYLSWADNFGISAQVSVLGEGGQLVTVLATATASGAIAFDADDNLYFAAPGLGFPPDPTEIYRFTRQQLQRSQQFKRPLTLADGELYATLPGAFSIQIDQSGDLFATDSFSDLLLEVDAETRDVRIVLNLAGGGLTYARIRDNGEIPFEPYMPEEAGTLALIESDFFSFSDIVLVQPERPTLASSVPNPIAPGSYDIELKGGPFQGIAFVYLAANVSGEEQWLDLPNANFPMLFGLDLSAGLFGLVPVSTDNFGEFSSALVNPGLPGATLGLQAFVSLDLSSPVLGSSPPLFLQYQ